MTTLPSEFDVKVVGVSFVPAYPSNFHEIEADLEDGDRPLIELRRNPSNKVDSNAIEVRRTANDEMLGHLPKDVARRLAPEIDKGSAWLAAIVSVDINPDYSDRPGLTITIQKDTRS